MTPLGVPVVPEVYCRNASASGPMFGSLHAAARSGPIPSIAISVGSGSSGAKKVGMRALSTAEVRIALAPASATIPLIRSMCLALRGGFIGTATTPAVTQP